jgi:hypothetical protein
MPNDAVAAEREEEPDSNDVESRGLLREQTSERSRLVGSPEELLDSREKLRAAVTLILAIAYYIIVSCFLINYNKFLMAGPFPHSVVLTAMHMLVSFMLSLFVYAIFGYSTHPSMEQVNGMNRGKFVMKLFPLALAFAISVVLSNEAYRYCSVPFLQMCKELNVVFVYVASVLFALERLSGRTCMILLVVLFGCTISIQGQVDFNAKGFTLQITSQMAEICKMLLQAFIMQNLKIDPLTMVMWMAPLCLCAVASAIMFSWEPVILVDAKSCWKHLLANSCVAFLLNHSVAYLLRISSGLTMVLAGIVKDICIVSMAAIIFGASLAKIQIVGFFIAIIGIFAHSMVKSFPEVADEHGVLKGILMITFQQIPEKRKE